MRKPVYTKRFEKDLAKCQKRDFCIGELKAVMLALINNETLEAKHRPHRLQGDYAGFWECHIRPDWLLIYTFADEKDKHGQIIQSTITFVRTGTHSDLF